MSLCLQCVYISDNNSRFSNICFTSNIKCCVFFLNLTLQTPKSVLTSFAQLTTYLENPVRQANSRDEVMVRAILVWLGHQVVEKFTSEEGTRDTPLGFLSLLGHKRSTYSTFFTLLCRYKHNLIYC